MPQHAFNSMQPYSQVHFLKQNQVLNVKGLIFIFLSQSFSFCESHSSQSAIECVLRTEG